MNKSEKTRRAFIFGLATITILLYSGSDMKADFEFGTAERLGPSVNSIDPSVHEHTPRISADGLLLAVARTSGEDWQQWEATRATKHDPWNTAVRVDAVKLGPDIVVPGFTPMDGLEFYGPYFDSPAGYGHDDLYFRIRETMESPWSDLINVGPPVNTPYAENHPSISSDGLELCFSDYQRPRPGGYGSEDIWVTRRSTRNDSWQEPENLGAQVNSPSAESCVHTSIDGLLLFYCSNRPGGHGGWDLYVTRRKSHSGPWGIPANLGPKINSSAQELYPCISPDGRELYFVRNKDIWRASVAPVVDFSGDDQVNAADMSILINHWHTSDPLCDIGPTPLGDGVVDFQDLKVLSEYLEPGFGRIAHWKLDETEGAVAYNSIGSDHANVHGEAVWQPDGGQMAGALEFDGVDDYVAPMCSLNPQDGPFRILAWIKGGAPGQVIASQTPTEFELGGTYLAADPADGTLMTEAVLPMTLKSDAIITDDEWHEVGLEWDGKWRHLYVDDNEVTVDDMALPGLPNTGYLNIGTGKAFEDRTFWSGLIDDVRVYKQGEKQ
jgi:hypothetical protein